MAWSQPHIIHAISGSFVHGSLSTQGVFLQAPHFHYMTNHTLHCFCEHYYMTNQSIVVRKYDGHVATAPDMAIPNRQRQWVWKPCGKKHCSSLQRHLHAHVSPNTAQSFTSLLVTPAYISTVLVRPNETMSSLFHLQN